MELTSEQMTLLEQGEVVEITVAGRQCVLMDREMFSALQSAEESPRDAYASVLKAIDQDDENPDQYLEYLQ